MQITGIVHEWGANRWVSPLGKEVSWLMGQVSTKVTHPEFVSESWLFQIEDTMFSQATWETLTVINATDLRSIVQAIKDGVIQYYQISPVISEWEVQAFPVVWSTFGFRFPIQSRNLWVLIRYPRLPNWWSEERRKPDGWKTEGIPRSTESSKHEDIMNLAHTMRTRPSVFTQKTRLTLTIWWENIVLHFARINQKLFEFSDDTGNYFALPIPTATNQKIQYFRWKMNVSAVSYSKSRNEAEFVAIEYGE